MKKIYLDKRWIDFRNKNIEDHCYCCQSINNLQLHHNSYIYYGKIRAMLWDPIYLNETHGEFLNMMPLLNTLCRECHDEWHRIFNINYITINIKYNICSPFISQWDSTKGDLYYDELDDDLF